MYYPKSNSVNVTWPPEAHYAPAEPGRRHLRIHAQPQELQTVLRNGIRTAIDWATVSGFFRLGEDYTGIRTMLQDISLELDFGLLAARLEEDEAFGREVSQVVSS